MLTFRPDDDQFTEGIFTDISNAIPTNRGGYQNANDSVDLGYTSLPGTCIGTAFIRRLDASVRIFAGISQQIREADQTTAGTSGSWLNVSRSTTYATSGSWTFAQLGDVSLAASYENRLQFSNGTVGTAFADVAGAPNAKIAFTLNNRVILLNTSGYTGSGQDGWACSSEGDYFTSTLWPPASTNNAAYGNLRETGGPITAGCSLGSLAIAWKRSGMWIGQDQGAPVQMVWQKIPGDYGCVGLFAWCDIEGGIFFVSPQAMFIFDGSRPRSITDGIKATFFATYQADLNAGTIECLHDETNNRVHVFLKTAAVTWTFNYRTLQWGQLSGFRGTVGEPMQCGLKIAKSSAYSVRGFSATITAQNSICVFYGNKLMVVGSPSMRSGTTASITFNWWSPIQGQIDYTGMMYQSPRLQGVTLSGFAEGVLSNAGTLVSNSQYPRLDGTYSGKYIAPKITVTNSSSGQFEFTQFSHKIKKVGTA